MGTHSSMRHVAAALLLLQGVLAGSMFDLPNYRGSVEEAMPSSEEFYKDYSSGFGKPFKMTGYAKRMPAFEKWSTDAGLIKLYGREQIENIEFAKKETRHAHVSSASLEKFLSLYNTSDCYAVSSVPGKMGEDFHLPHFLNCGYATKYLEGNNMWFSRGGTKSQIHNDDQDNVNCVISGSKRFIFFHPHNRTYIESPELGLGPLRSQDDYGAFSGNIDVDNVDLAKYGGWAKLGWWDATLEAGNCLFIPTSWYHHVHSTGRSLAVNLWWWRKEDIDGSWDFNCAAADKDLTIAGCEWSYEGPPDKPGTPAKAHQLTACSGQKGQSPSQWQHADSFITQWQRMPTQVLISALEKKLSYSKGAPIEPQIDIMQAWHKQKPITRQLIWSALTDQPSLTTGEGARSHTDL